MSKREPCTQTSNVPVLQPSLVPDDVVRRGPVRATKMGKWRALALISVHVLALFHILHWKTTGETVAPLEPSEAMYTVARGTINAGAILLVLALLSTLIFGRWFCGWACHLVAIQDFCAWLMKKAGIRPKPLRSRFLMWVPLAAGLYMFIVSPIGARLAADLGAPEFSLALKKTAFWETFPGIIGSIITILVTGFAMIYFLGSKGFCTYACPYGGLFHLVDRFSPARIRVTDACKACGHCTVACTSNVVVHREVLEYGMVVDPGCMKCADCISVCPENALYFGFGKPAAGSKPIRATRPRTWSFTLAEEVGLVVAFLVSLTIFVGLPHFLAAWAPSYLGKTALLLGVGLASTTALLFFTLLRLLGSGDLGLQNLKLLDAGKITGPGRLFAAIGMIWITFTLVAGVAQASFFVGEKSAPRTEMIAITGRDLTKTPLDADTRARLERAERAYAISDRFTFGRDVRIPWRRTSLAFALGKKKEALEFAAETVLRDPDLSATRLDYARLLTDAGRTDDAVREFTKALELDPQSPDARREAQLTALRLGGEGDLVRAMRLITACLGAEPENLALKMALASCQLDSGDSAAAERTIASLKEARTTDPATAQQLASFFAGAGDLPSALVHIRRRIELAPSDPAAYDFLARVLKALGMDADAAKAEADAKALREKK